MTTTGAARFPLDLSDVPPEAPPERSGRAAVTRGAEQGEEEGAAVLKRRGSSELSGPVGWAPLPRAVTGTEDGVPRMALPRP